MKIREKLEEKIPTPMLLRPSPFGKAVKHQYTVSVLVEYVSQ